MLNFKYVMKPSHLTKRGIALLLVLTVIAVLSAVVVEFAYTTRVSVRLGTSYRDFVIAESIARSGIEIAKKLLIQDINSDRSSGDMSDFRVNPEELMGDEELWSQTGILAEMFEPFETGRLILKIDDEGGKFNLNMLVGMDGSRDEKMVQLAVKLFKNMGVESPEDLVDSIVDWIDADTFGEYEDGAKNAQMESITELGLLPGMDYLRYTQVVGVAPDMPVFSKFLTVYPQRRYEQGAKVINWTVNVNTAPKEVLMTIVKDCDDSCGESIIEEISKSHMKSGAEFVNFIGTLGLELEQGVNVVVRSDVFSVTSEGIVGGEPDEYGTIRGGVSSVIRAVLQRSDTESGNMEILYWREE
jgi:general secretion pathway protein K